MCSVIGITANHAVNQALYEALTVLQHRGQDAAGIMTSDRQRVYLRKNNGLVRDVFRTRDMLKLKGNMGIAHSRYPTAGCDSRAEAQPFYVNSPFGIALGHNGNLTNTAQLRTELFEQDLRQLNTSSDSEILLNVFAHELRDAVGESRRAAADDVFDAVAGVYRRCKGAYAVVAMVVGVGLLAFRDACGIRPLVYGSRTENGHTAYMFASESVALDVQGYRLIGDVLPGEVVFIDLNGHLQRRICAARTMYAPCIFEYVYLARPDSVMDRVPVYQSRMEMGHRLGLRLQQLWPQHDIDVVIPVPDTSRTSALEMANVLNLPYREGFIKNRYIGRTFIMPGQVARQRSVRQKLNAIGTEFYGKNVLLVDDSVVRGTTSQKIIQLAREAGAKKVYFASAAPPVRFPNVYGIDMPYTAELVAHNRSVEEICAFIGADKLIYQQLDDLIDAVNSSADAECGITQFDTSCFSGEYVTGDITPAYLEQIDRPRAEPAQ